MLRSLSPFDGSLVAEHPIFTEAELEAAVALAHDHSRLVRRYGSGDLASHRRALERLSDELASDIPELATLAAREMGRPYAQAVEEVKKCVQACRLVASRREGWLAPERVTSAALDSCEGPGQVRQIRRALPLCWQVWHSGIVDPPSLGCFDRPDPLQAGEFDTSLVKGQPGPLLAV